MQLIDLWHSITGRVIEVKMGLLEQPTIELKQRMLVRKTANYAIDSDVDLSISTHPQNFQIHHINCNYYFYLPMVSKRSRANQSELNHADPHPTKPTSISCRHIFCSRHPSIIITSTVLPPPPTTHPSDDFSSITSPPNSNGQILWSTRCRNHILLLLQQ